jgi:hypothetical protein
MTVTENLFVVCCFGLCGASLPCLEVLVQRPGIRRPEKECSPEQTPDSKRIRNAHNF